MLPQNLADWLQFIRSLHSSAIDYSLERIHTVAKRLDLLQPNVPVITVTGTNGKGSVVSTLEAILVEADYAVGSFTSPYIENFNEQIRLNKIPATDAMLMQAFSEINAARQATNATNATNAISSVSAISLSEFEFATLAALLIFKQAGCNVLLLEVGLGGGNDAVNIIDADVLVVTTIAFDHEEYLGRTLADIAATEAQLLRPEKIAVVGETNLPAVFLTEASKKGCHVLRMDPAESAKPCFQHLAVLPQNAALAVQALRVCPGVHVTEDSILKGLQQIQIRGRQQFSEGSPCWLIDVAHNPEAIAALVEYLNNVAFPGKIIAVFSMLKDKKIAAAIGALDSYVTKWCVAPIEHPRGASLTQILQGFETAGVNREKCVIHANLKEACVQAIQRARPQDLILAFGSFYIAQAALSFLMESKPLKNPHKA